MHMHTKFLIAMLYASIIYVISLTQMLALKAEQNKLTKEVGQLQIEQAELQKTEAHIMQWINGDR
jgi:hypothetical protein